MFINRSIARDLLALRHELVTTKDWARNSLGSSIGPKIVEGAATDELAIHFIVKDKLPRTHLRAAERIPPAVSGVATDVLRGRGELEMKAAHAPADQSGVGYGSGILTESFNTGTVGIAARDSNGDVVLTTAAHVVYAGEPVSLLVRRTALGRTRLRVEYAWGRDFYGQTALSPNERFTVDMALIRPRANIPIRHGLPGSHSFKVPKRSGDVVRWIVGQSALAYGAGSSVWRSGVVIALWPRRNRPPRSTGFCSIQQSPQSALSDSGSVWLTRRNGSYVAFGAHWGKVSAYAFVTDLSAIQKYLNLVEILGTTND